MQTFLPFPDFTKSAEVLDSPRLGKQRVETLQVLRALELSEYGWANHPAVRMWRGFTPGLVAYGLATVHEWRRRGHADSTAAQIVEFAPEQQTQQELAALGQLPSWLGDERLHLSHRSALVRKDPERYRPLFGDIDDSLEYWWPAGSDAAPRAVEGLPMWVLRAGSAEVHDHLLTSAHIGLGSHSGVDVDAEDADLADLLDLLAERSPGRRPGKDLRQLHAFVQEVSPGDLVGLLHPGERELTVGTVTGHYSFDRGRTPDPDHPRHRRAVRWSAVLPRSAVRPPASLQDPRRLFAVVIDPAALPADSSLTAW